VCVCVCVCVCFGAVVCGLGVDVCCSVAGVCMAAVRSGISNAQCGCGCVGCLTRTMVSRDYSLARGIVLERWHLAC
jgi:hypothetical protein